MFDNNEAWRKEMLAEDRNYFKKLAKPETPEYLWVGM
jgi:carbonic anhydrase